MNELVPARSQLTPRAADPFGTLNMSAEPIPIDVPGPGLKRDYAGLLEYWQMIRRHKGAVILATCVGTIIGFFLTLSEPRIYQAQTTLEIQGLNEEFLNIKNVNPTAAETSSGTIGSDIQTQVKILQSMLILNRVRAKLDARQRPANLQPPDRLGVWRKALKVSPPSADVLWKQALGIAAGNVKVRSSGMTRIVEVSCDSTNAQLAADFCNTLTQEYIDENLEARWKTTEYTGQWLTKQLQDLKIKIEKSEEEMQSYARSTGLMFTGQKSGEKDDVQETRLADLQKELSTAQADRITKQSKYELAVASSPEALPEVLDDQSFKESQRALFDLQAKLAQLRITFTPNHAEVRRAEAQLTAMEASLRASRSNILTRIRNDYESAQRREKLLASAYTAQARLVSGHAEENAHYSLLKREVDASRQIYDNLLQQLKQASIASALRANNIRVVDVADRPSGPYKPDVPQQAAIGLLFGLVVGVAFSVLRERADRTLQDPGDAAFYLGVPELGVIPVGELSEGPRSKSATNSLGLQVKNGRSPNGGSFDDRVEMISWREKSSLLAESFRTTLTSILFSRSTGDRPRILVLTSASPKEGKTTVVSNLGVSLAEINQRVLLIDADLRRPRLHLVFGIENTRGLSDLLLETTPLDMATVEAACAPTVVPGLFVLPSGSSRRSASSLLHSARLGELLNLAREKFDMVVVDTPPMVNIADARVVARLSDALILVVRSGVTSRDAALLAKNRFADDGIPVLGTILNFWNPRTPGYSYYRYYYSGYYHYYGNGNGNHKGSDGENHNEDGKVDLDTDRPKAERFSEIGRDLSESRESGAKYRGLLEAAPDAIVVVDHDGQIVLLNAKAEKQFGFRRDELVGRNVKNIIPEGFGEWLIADVLRFAEDAMALHMSTGIELSGRRKDGSEFPIEIMLSPFQRAEGILMTAAIRDITTRKKAEAHLVMKVKELILKMDESRAN